MKFKNFLISLGVAVIIGVVMGLISRFIVEISTPVAAAIGGATVAFVASIVNETGSKKRK